MKTLDMKTFSGCIALLQLENMNDSERIATYMRSLPQNSIVLLGEYVVDSFFSEEWQRTPHACLKDKHKLDIFTQYAGEYGHTFIVPTIHYKNKGYYKHIAIIAQEGVATYAQQRLIQYEHWNEANFFSNDTSKLPKAPFTFNAGAIRCGVLFGFEAHFDEFWTELKRSSVDVVFVPTVSTFASQERWRNLLTTHAFTNSCYVCRANRIGIHESSDGQQWKFYGHSFVSLGQDIVDSLEGDEGMLCVEINHEALQSLKKEWGFRS